jgi:hypothetical protein
MRCSLSSSHYAARWGKPDYSLEAMTALGIKYAALQDGPEREDVLLTIVKAFHAYILKYVNMIMRGHLPTWRGYANRDSANFLRRFLRPGDSPVNRESYRLACRTMHLAFKNQTADEIYNILAGLLIKVIDAYDPAYTTKIKMVAQAIDRLDAGDVILDEELDVDFYPRRFLR